jgi:hypothetical protein
MFRGATGFYHVISILTRGEITPWPGIGLDRPGRNDSIWQRRPATDKKCNDLVPLCLPAIFLKQFKVRV